MNREYHIIGMMSGTSLDGLDIVKCIFDGNDLRKYEIEKCETIPYSEYWTKTLRHLHTQTEEKIQDVNIKYAKLLAKLFASKPPFPTQQLCNNIDALGLNFGLIILTK